MKSMKGNRYASLQITVGQIWGFDKTLTHMKSEWTGTAVTKGRENGQNKPPKLNSPHFAWRVKLGRLILSILFPLCPVHSRD